MAFANGMNTGVDYTLQYYNSDAGQLISVTDIQNVKFTAMKHDIKSMPYNGVPKYGYVPDGFRFNFTITRTGPTLENLMVTFRQNFNAGNVTTPGYLNKTIHNPDGTISQFQYTNVVVFLTDPGDISRDKVTTQTFEGYASDEIALQTVT